MWWIFIIVGTIIGSLGSSIYTYWKSGIGYFWIVPDSEDPEEGVINVRIPEQVVYKQHRINKIILIKSKGMSQK